MSFEGVMNSRRQLEDTIGKNLLNVKHPNEFELYVLGLELCDENFSTLKYFVFPVNPSQFEENKPKITNIKKTLAGITVLKTPTFVPTDINISGNFGRGFKIHLGSTYEDFIHSFATQNILGSSKFSANKGTILGGLKQTFDERIKTGYGCIKILEDIIEASSQIGENGKQYRLIFHNPALGNSYLVEPISLKFNMSEQSNMVWNYGLQLKSIAPLEVLYGMGKLGSQEEVAKKLVATGYMQKRVNGLLNSIAPMVKQVS